MREALLLCCFCLALGLSAALEAAEEPAAPQRLLLHEEFVIGLDPDQPPLGRIRDIAIGSDGALLVVDANFGLVRRFSVEGEFLGDLGRQGEGPGEYDNPDKVEVAPDGRVFVADGSSFITVFLPDGLPDEKIHREVQGTVRDMFVGPNGVLYLCVVDSRSQRMIQRFDLHAGEWMQPFCESLLPRDPDARVEEERTFGGGFLAELETELAYLQWQPQLLEIYSMEGDLRRSFTLRGSDWAPRSVRYEGDSVHFGMIASFSNTLLHLGGDRVLVASFDRRPEPHKGYLDVYDTADGRRVALAELEGEWWRGAVMDSAGRIYSPSERDDEVVILRYRLEFTEAGEGDGAYRIRLES